MKARVLFLLAAGLTARLQAQVPADSTITEAERQGLHVSSDSIWNPSLRFSFPNPKGAFLPNPDLQNMLDGITAGHPDLVDWAFADSGRRQAVLVAVARIVTLEEGNFRAFTGGIKLGAAHSTVLGETVTWSGLTGEYLLTMQHPNGVYLGVRCLSAGQAPGLIVCVQTITAAVEDLKLVRAGFRLQ